MALFCIILIVISSVLEIKAMHAQNQQGKGRQKNRRVSESPRQTFYPRKVTVHVT